MKLLISPRSVLVSTVLAMLLVPTPAMAQSPEDQWHFSIMPYLWLPTIEGTINHKGGGASGSPSVDVKVGPDDYLSELDGALLLAAEARKGKWSFLADVTYFKVSDDASAVRGVDFNLGPIHLLSASLNAGADTEIEATIWTLTGGYNVVQNPSASLDLIAGARYLNMEITTNWRLTASVSSPIGGAVFPATGTISDKEDFWDGIVGVRGRVKLDEGNWFMPYHIDVGTGSSDLTWQAQIGVGYAFRWGDALLGYRYLAYEFGDDKLIKDLKLGGFGLAAIFHF